MVLLHLLGPVRAGNGGMESSFGSAMVRGLTLRLALSANRRVTRTSLVEALWDRAPASAEANLRVYVSALRRELARLCDNAHADLRTHREGEGGYTLSLPEIHIDLYRFRQLRGRARAAQLAGEAGTAERLLREALALWHGDAGEGMLGSRRLTATAAAITMERLEAMEDWLFVRLALGEGSTLVADARALALEDPLRERAAEALMRAFLRSGDVAGALRTYRHHRDALAAELGSEPTGPLQALHCAVLRGEHTYDRASL